jgi:cell division protein FtsW
MQKTDYILLAVVGILVAMGLVMVYSASFVEAFNLHQTQFYYLFRQSIGAFIGAVGMLVAWRLDYRVWRRFSLPFMAFALALLIAVLVLPTSITEVNGSRSWIRFGGGTFSIQPSEIAKLAMIVYFADWLSRRGEAVSRVDNVTYGVLPFAVMLGVVCGLVYYQPDRGTMVVLVVIASVVYFAAGANMWHVVGAAASFGAVVWLFISKVGTQNGRIQAFIDPWEVYHSFGYQPIHSLYALASGGIFGVGLGQARQKFQWLPQAHTDSIFAIIGEEFGLIGTMLMLLAFALIAYRGYRIACRVPDRFASLVAVGITSWLVFQALLNMAVTTSLVPFTGLTLPFISYGSTSLIMCMVGTGILLNISQHMETQELEEPRDAPKTHQRSPALEFFQHTGQVVATLPAWHIWKRKQRARTRGAAGNAPGRRQRSAGGAASAPASQSATPDVFDTARRIAATLPVWRRDGGARVPGPGGSSRTRRSSARSANRQPASSAAKPGKRDTSAGKRSPAKSHVRRHLHRQQ